MATLANRSGSSTGRNAPDDERIFEHLGLAGALLLVAFNDLKGERMAEQTENRRRRAASPLKIPLFLRWGATVLGNVGSFMRDVASSWLITDLSSNPSAVALMQTAATLPVFLLAIPAGVLSGHSRSAALSDLRANSAGPRQRQPAGAVTDRCVDGGIPAGADLRRRHRCGADGADLAAIVPELVPRTELKTPWR